MILQLDEKRNLEHEITLLGTGLILRVSTDQFERKR